MSGHTDLAKKREKVLGFCRDAFNGFGLNPLVKWNSTHAVSNQDDVYLYNLENPSIVRGYFRDLEGLQQWASSIGSYSLSP